MKSVVCDFIMTNECFETKYLAFIEKEGKPKTKVFSVHSKCSDCELGEIKWFPAWRHYCFFPCIDLEAVYSDRCLFEISNFIKELNEARKVKA